MEVFQNTMKKRAIESRVEQVYQIRPEHLNGAGRLFGGRLMECNVITASVDNLKFIRGVFQNDLVVLVGTLTWVGSTSMEVRVDTYVEKLNGTRYPVNRAYLTLVAVDETGKPTKVPGLLIESIGQQAEWEAGQKRKELRIQRNKEGF